MLLGTLGASLLGNILAGKGVNRADTKVFNGIYSRGNLSRIMDGVYIINPDEYSDIELIGLACTCKIMM